MELNTEIWGTYEDNAQPITSGSSGDALHYSDKSGAESLLAYYNTYGRNEPIDESINYWQVADFSSLNYHVYMKLNGNNDFEYTTTKAEKPISIFLAKATPSNLDMSFNPAASGNRMWNDFVTGSTGYTNNHKIFPWFDYNKVLLRPSLYVFKLDENGNPTGSSITTGNKSKIYNFFHDDENGIPIREQYVITGINLYFLYGSETAQLYSAYDYPCLATSTALEVPKPNYYLNDKTYFNTYQRIGSMNIGSNSRQLNVTQNGAYGQSTASSNCYIYDPRYWEIKEYQVGTSTYRYFAYTGTYEDLLRQLATIGFWFRDDVEGGTYSASGTNAKTIGSNCTDSHCFLPEIKNGRTTGNYKQGNAAGLDPQSQWGADWRENAGYNGDTPYKNEESSTTPFINALKISSFSNIYMLRADNIYGLAEELKTYVSGETYDPNYFFGQNPIDCIAMLRIYPFNMLQMQCAFEVQNFDWVTSFAPVKIGEWVSENSYGVAVDNIKTDGADEYTLWEYTETIAGRYDDFRDYEPYSTYDIYLPFCGTTNIDPKIFLNRPITIRYTLDGLSGILTAYILVEGKIYKSISGNCAIDIPVSGYKISDYIENMYNLSNGQAIAKNESLNALLSMVTGTGNAVMAQGINSKHSSSEMVLAGAIIQAVGNVGTALNNYDSSIVKRLSYQHYIDCSAPQPAFVQSGKGLDSWSAPMGIYILAKTCEMLPYNEEVYSKTTGHACCIYSTLGSQHEDGKDNLVQVNDIILDGIELTEMEKRNLLSLLQSGVII